MKAFKSFGLVLALALGSWGCESDDDPAFDPAHLPGTWIHAEKDGQAVPADDRFVSTYRADGTETYAIRGNANHWVETDGYAYAIGGRTIAVAGHGTQLEYDVEELSDSKLVYRVSRLVVGGQDLEDASVYVLRKPAAAKVDVELRYVGFDIAPEFVVGYGLDYAERYRTLPFIATLAPHVYASAAR